MLRSLETFAKFLRVLVSKTWFRKKSLGFGFGKIWSRKKVSVPVSENLVSEEKYRFRKNLVSEKSLGFGFGELGLGKKSQFRKIGYRKKSLGIGFGQNFGIVIQWCRGHTGCCLGHFLWTTLLPSISLLI